MVDISEPGITGACEGGADSGVRLTREPGMIGPSSSDAGTSFGLEAVGPSGVLNSRAPKTDGDAAVGSEPPGCIVMTAGGAGGRMLDGSSAGVSRMMISAADGTGSVVGYGIA